MPRAHRAPRALLVSPLLALAMLWPLAGGVSARGEEAPDAVGAGTARPIAYDVSYPQCGKELPDTFAFAIVGVNGGRVYSANRCLGAGDQPSLLAWAGRNAQLYANTGNPGPRMSRYWPTEQNSPRICTDDDPDTRSCAYNYGWNAAADSYATALAAYVSLGWAEADATRLPDENTWWLDVETANSWRADPGLNVAALRGAVDYLESMGAPEVGFYSAPRMWERITGGTDYFADHPSWVAGATTLQGALRVCRSEGFTGGPVTMAQYLLDGLDANVVCEMPQAEADSLSN